MKSSLCTGTLCTDRREWFVAHGGGKVVSIHGLLCTDLGQLYVAKDGEKVASVHGLCVLI